MSLIVMMVMVVMSANAQRITNLDKDITTGDYIVYTSAGVYRVPAENAEGFNRLRVGEDFRYGQQRIRYEDYRAEAEKYGYGYGYSYGYSSYNRPVRGVRVNYRSSSTRTSNNGSNNSRSNRPTTTTTRSITASLVY